MFTPPPSPLPKLGNANTVGSGSHTAKTPPPSPPTCSKRTSGRRFRWAVTLVPLVVILVTASTRYLVRPAAFDTFSQASWNTLTSFGGDWELHKRHPFPGPQIGSSSPATPTSTTAANQPVPTVPSSPPSLPTPFPQPFDSDLSQNFSSVSCSDFFSNMTNTQAFRACRPFSLLLQSSTSFIDAQSNATLLNSIMWGTCNTSIQRDQCVANMGWFTSTLKDACAKDLANNNAMTVSTLKALQAYRVMRDAACDFDPTTNTYCYLNAVRNPNPSDLYYYQVGIGTKVPNTSTPTCSACTRNVLRTYADAINDSKDPNDLSGLKKAYPPSAELAINQCGTTYAALTNGAMKGPGQNSLGWLNGILVVALIWMLDLP